VVRLNRFAFLNLRNRLISLSQNSCVSADPAGTWRAIANTNRNHSRSSRGAYFGNQRMLRISIESFPGQNQTLRLEGQLKGAWVKELSRSCEDALRNRKLLTLDLAAVSFVDRDGIALLRTLRNRDVAISNCSPFVEDQLNDGSR
jgi:ABC-type transporter Mla MlaB component